MDKRLFWLHITVISAVVAFSGVCALSQENVKTVEDSAFAERIRPRVDFFHDDHNEKAGIEECNQCHHVHDGTQLVPDESSEDKECSACHVGDQKENLLGLANTFHLRCKGCHEDTKKGPVMCSECHVKKQ